MRVFFWWQQVSVQRQGLHYPFINETINQLISMLFDKAEEIEEKYPKAEKQEGKEGDGDSIKKGDAKQEEAAKA